MTLVGSSFYLQRGKDISSMKFPTPEHRMWRAQPAFSWDLALAMTLVKYLFTLRRELKMLFLQLQKRNSPHSSSGNALAANLIPILEGMSVVSAVRSVRKAYNEPHLLPDKKRVCSPWSMKFSTLQDRI
jgi:hypothetical protein